MFRFGVFDLDPATAELRKSGVRIRLHEQPYRVLSVLLQRAGEVVSRDELRRAVWPDETFVDFDHGLNSAVNKLREALGDSASHPRYIETVPRRGYRFVAPVESTALPSVIPAASCPEAPEPPAPRAGRLAGRWRVALVAGAFAVVLLAADYLYVRSPTVSVRIAALTNYAGHEVLPSVSPDGHHVAFAWNGEQESNYDIYVKTIGAEGALRLTNDPAVETNPAWSPDGSAIAFSRVRLPDTLEVWVISPFGESSARKIGEMRQPRMFDAVTRPGGADTHKRRRIAWLEKREWLVVQHTADDQQWPSLFLLSARTGEKRRLTLPPANSMGDRSPAVSPEGRRIAFTRRVSGSRGEIYVLQLAAGLEPASEPVRVMSMNAEVEDPAWTADGREIVFSAGTRHNPGLWRVAASGTEAPRRIYDSGDRALHPAVAGTRLVYSHWTQDVNIWKVDVPQAGAQAAATRFIASTYLDHMPTFSPDGKRVAFISNRAGVQDVWLVNADGSNLTRLTSLVEGEALSLNWAPDGKRIVFQLNSGERAEVHELTIDGGPPRRLSNVPGLGMPAWSRDGRFAYWVAHVGGEAQIFRSTLDSIGDTGRATQVTTAGGAAPAESADSTCLYYVKQNAVWRMPLPSGGERQISPSLSYAANFALAKDGLFFIPEEFDHGRSRLEFLELATGSRRVLHLIPVPVMWGVTASPDGRSVLYTRLDHAGSDLKIIEDFR